MQPTVLILGVCDRFGLAAARAFANTGWRVLGQVCPGGVVPSDRRIKWLSVDLRDSQALALAARGAAVVLHAANPPNSLWEQQAMPALEQAIALSIELQALLMLPGDVCNFGSTMPALLLEDTPQHADTRKGWIRVAMERRLRQASETGALNSVVVRAGDFVGSGRSSWFERVLTKNLQHGKLSYPCASDVPTACAYLPDLAIAFERLARRALLEPARFAPFDVFHFKGFSLSRTDWLAVLTPLAREQGWIEAQASLKCGTVPWALFRSLAWAVPQFRELLETEYLWQTPHALTNDKLCAMIGPEPHMPLSLAVKATLTDLGLLTLAPSDTQRLTMMV